ncbi:MAG: DUF58 domain-containing protein [Betaproteobacteria bacterium]
MLIPAPWLLRLLAAWLAFSVIVSIWPMLTAAWIAASVAALAVVIADAWLTRRTLHLEARRTLPYSAPLGGWIDVRIRLSNAGRIPVTCTAYDHHPAQCAIEGLPRRHTIAAGGWFEFAYRLRPTSRGDLTFDTLELRTQSPFALWQRRMRVGARATLRVYPNFAALARYALFATDNRLSQMGVLQRRRRGEGVDFDQLREYREGDSQRKIDWKASQRMQKLISRDYRDERDQQVVFLIDCGRRMRAQDDDYSHFDHALDATLLLAHVGVRQGDAVGLLTMSGPHVWLAPRKSQAMVNLMLNHTYTLQPSLLTSDYYQAAVELSRRLKKRALVVLVSNLRDEDDDTLLPALRLLQKRHLVLFASLRERTVDDTINAPVEDYEHALTHAAAVEYRVRREAAFRRLKQGDVVCLDVPPQRLAMALVNQYLDIKRSGQL